MMKMFAIYDVKADFYANPFTARTTAEALRSFAQAANDEKITISQNPEDFALYELAIYDEQTGQISPLDVPMKLGIAAEYQTKQSA